MVYTALCHICPSYYLAPVGRISFFLEGPPARCHGNVGDRVSLTTTLRLPKNAGFTFGVLLISFETSPKSLVRPPKRSRATPMKPGLDLSSRIGDPTGNVAKALLDRNTSVALAAAHCLVSLGAPGAAGLMRRRRSDGTEATAGEPNRFRRRTGFPVSRSPERKWVG